MVRSIETIGWGWSRFVFDVNGEYIFKIPRNAEDNTEWDIKASKNMKNVLGSIVPEYSLISENDFLVAGYKKIGGIHITSESFEGRPLGNHPDELKKFHERIASELADALNILHSDTTKKMMTAVEGISYETNLREKYEKLYGMVENAVFPLISADARKNIASSFQGFFNRIDLLGFEPKFIHGDFGGWNILFNEGSMKLVGIIDWGGSRIGDPALDFSELLYDFGPNILSSVRNMYLHETDEWFWERINFYLRLEGFLDFFESGSEEFTRRGLERIVKSFSGKPA